MLVITGYTPISSVPVLPLNKEALQFLKLLKKPVKPGWMNGHNDDSNAYFYHTVFHSLEKKKNVVSSVLLAVPPTEIYLMKEFVFSL